MFLKTQTPNLICPEVAFCIALFLCGLFLMMHLGKFASAGKGDDLLKALINCTFIPRFAHFININKCTLHARNHVRGTDQTDNAHSPSLRSWQVKQILAIHWAKSAAGAAQRRCEAGCRSGSTCGQCGGHYAEKIYELGAGTNRPFLRVEKKDGDGMQRQVEFVVWWEASADKRWVIEIQSESSINSLFFR